MALTLQLPPDPTNAVLKRIYPWDRYDISLVMQWLFAQAQKTGFTGTLNDFKLRYGAYIESIDPQEIYDLISHYEGSYHITPLVNITQTLQTKNQILNQDIIIDPIPDDIINNYQVYGGQYHVIPMVNIDQILRTKDNVLEEDVVVEKIPYAEVSNNAGGTTVIIG